MPSLRHVLSGAMVAVAAEARPQDPRSCDNAQITIFNQTDLDFYKKCTVIRGAEFTVSQEFEGAFKLPGVKSLPGLFVGYPGFEDEEEDSYYTHSDVTAISLPDLTEITFDGLVLGYMSELKGISFPKLETVATGLVITGNNDSDVLSFPALKSVTGGLAVRGNFSRLDFPSLKTVNYMYVHTGSKVGCKALGKQFESLKYTSREVDDIKGFECVNTRDGSSFNSTGAGIADPTKSPYDALPKPGDKSNDDDSKNAADKLDFGQMYGYVALASVLAVLVL